MSPLVAAAVLSVPGLMAAPDGRSALPFPQDLSQATSVFAVCLDENVGSTGLSATVLFPADPGLTHPGGALEPGDEIALLTPDGSCAGLATWTPDGGAIAVWADDPFTPAAEGLGEGEPLRFAVWDASAGRAYEPADVAVAFEPGYEAAGGFHVDALYIVAGQAAGPDGDPSGAPTDGPPAPAEPGPLALAAPYPNPVRAEATVAFTVPEPGPVTVDVFDALGRLVAQPLDGERPAGAHAVSLDASGLPAGVYVVRLRAGGAVVQRRITVAR